MNRLRRYSGGGYNNPYYMDPSRTGWQSPTSAQTQTPNTGVSDTGPKVNGNQIAGYISTGVGAIAGAVTAGMNTKASVDAMEAANRLGHERNLAAAKTRVQGMQTSGNQYGTYGTMYGQYGGAVLGYGNGSALSPGNAEGGLGFGGANLEYGDSNPGLAEAAGAASIGRGVSDAALTSVPGWGQAYGAAKQVSTGIQSAYGTEWRETESGDIREVYGSEGDTSSEAQAKGALGNLWKPAHEHAMESFERGDIGEGILDLTGLSTIGRMVEGASDAEDARSARIRFNRENRRNMGGHSAFDRNRMTNQELAMESMQERQIPTAKYGGLMPEYKSGGYMDAYKGGGLYANIHAKRERIKAGSGESMRSPGSEGAPTDRAFTDSAKTAKMGMGGYMEYADGGIHIDPSKRGTFKAQATRMDMGVQEAADKILSAPEGTYSPEMRKKANFARNFAKKYGGMMEYQKGGLKLASESDVQSGSRNLLSPTSAFTEQGTRIINRYPDSPNDTSYMYMNPYTSYFYNTGQNAPGGRPVQNFSGAEGTPDNSYYQNKVKELAKYQTGGKISTMRGVPKEKANALLEGNGKNDTHNGELVLRPGGKVMAVKGPRHSEGDTPVVLQAGDRVLSDYIKHPVTGNTIAETYEDALKRGASKAELESIWNTQEIIASRATGQGMEQTAKSGGLMKYQNGTPPSLSPFIQNPNMTVGQIDAYNKLREQKRAGTVSAVASVQKKTPPALNKQQMQTIPVKTPYGGSVGNQASMQTIPTKGLPKTALPATLPMAYTPAPTTAHLKSAPENTPNYLKYAPEAISGLGSLAAIIATATQDFDKVPIPQANRVKADKMFLDRISPEADIARSQQDFRAMLNATLRGGQGPGASSTAQEAYSAKVRADEQARANADRLNIQIDATEKAGNIDSKLKADMFNEENAARYREMLFAQNTASEAFERERTQAIVNQVLRGKQAVADTAMNRRYAESISGESGVLERDQKKALKALFTNMGLDVPDFLAA